MKRTLTAPGYIYSAGKDSEFLPFFERQYLKFVDRYDDEIADSPECKELGKKIGYAFFHNLRHQWVAFSKDEEDLPFDSLGDKGFDWKFLKNTLNADSNIYGVGLGTNISFEQEIATHTGATVHCFDPTPQAAEYIIPLAKADPNIIFHPMGVFSLDGVVKFYRPTEKGLGSLSATNLTYSDISLEAPVKRLQTIMTHLGHSKIDYLKIDIEGAEHGVLQDMLFSGIEPDQIGVEFDMPTPPWIVEKTIRWLLLAGYEVVEIWGLNCLFAKAGVIAKAKS